MVLDGCSFLPSLFRVEARKAFCLICICDGSGSSDKRVYTWEYMAMARWQWHTDDVATRPQASGKWESPVLFPDDILLVSDEVSVRGHQRLEESHLGANNEPDISTY